VPGAEYELNPARAEEQARLIAHAPQLAGLAARLVEWALKSGEDMPSELAQLAHQAQDILAEVGGLGSRTLLTAPAASEPVHAGLSLETPSTLNS